MNYTTESLYDVIEKVLIDRIKNEWFWKRPQDKHDLIVSYAIHDTHFDWNYNDGPHYTTPFGGFVVAISMILWDLEIELDSTEKDLEVCEQLAKIFLDKHMNSNEKLLLKILSEKKYK
jgi:hypothetical protein